MGKVRPIARARLLIALAVGALALAVWGVTTAQRCAAETTFRQGESALQMLTAMVDQETGMRGFALTGEERFLEPYSDGRREYASALSRARAAAGGERELGRSIEALDRTARRWQRLAEADIRRVRRDGPRSVSNEQALVRKRLFDRFRRENADLRADLRHERHDQLARAGAVAVGVVLLLSLLFGGLGHLLVQPASRARREREQPRSASGRSRPSSRRRCSPRGTSARQTPCSSAISSAACLAAGSP